MDFGHLSAYDSDIKFLDVIRQFVISETRRTDTIPSAYSGGFSKLDDGRDIRTVYPHGIEEVRLLLSQTLPLNFVGFIGYKRPTEEIGQDLVDKIWQIDRELITEMRNHSDIIAYVTGEREDGEWGNLVVLRKVDAIEKWRDSKIHATAISEISPKYYTKIRIHRGKLLHGFHGNFNCHRTLFLDYDSGKMIHREVKEWT
ncbi:hypothetical protein FSP39_002064 [Pinctada imbricata]|uniref:Uncharacterized protein n=1 Tax=Pinctada imbricata TaxID=66713 RepID=A0AA88XMR3_PINIB|nr:hypothetical protein FSP39_002064 [Pinctada imbricata]